MSEFYILRDRNKQKDMEVSVEPDLDEPSLAVGLRQAVEMSDDPDAEDFIMLDEVQTRKLHTLLGNILTEWVEIQHQRRQEQNQIDVLDKMRDE